MKEYPTPWQRKTMWAALTACFVVLLVIIVGAVIWAAANVISFLQPILIPVAIAAILMYLLDPLVAKMSRGTLSRTKAVALVFAIGFFALGGLGAWLVPTISIQSANFARQVPAYTDRARDYMVDLIYLFDQTFGLLGITGFLLSRILVPIYLFFLLNEKPRIQQRWKEYLPLRASPFRDEVAEVLSEINRYVTAYFRGQLLVCLVDGILIGVALAIFGLNFAPVIGAMVVVLTMIPYIGIIICWVPAVLIAAFQWGDWTHPFLVTLIFI